MLKSMTGFGSTLLTTGEITLRVELSSLNARFLDLDIRLPAPFIAKEPSIRNQIAEKLQRGKIKVAIEYDYKTGGAGHVHYNEDTFVAYYAQLKKLADRVIAPYDHIFPLALQAAEIAGEDKRDLTDSAEWMQLEKYILEAVDKCDQSRILEGRTLQGILYTCCKTIKDQLTEVESLEPKRTAKISNRVRARIAEHLSEIDFDESRIEQEILFSTEKIAINEEMDRLKSHLDLFSDVLDYPTSSGKKLIFIAQEMGREINTIGSKANDIAIQKLVIAMKEELEKIKEQLNNVV